MDYKKIEGDNYNIHLIKTDRFKTVNITVNFMNKIKKQEITKRNFLVNLLVYSCKKYPTRRDMVIKMQDLYAAQIGSSSERIGNYNCLRVNMTTLNNKYTNKRNLKDTFKFLKEVIFHPYVMDGGFDSESFKINYSKMEAEIKSIKEDPKKYSLIRMLEVMDKQKAYSYHGFGNLADLDKITKENLYTYYKKIMRKSVIDIFVIGDIDFNECEKIIKDNFKFKHNSKELNDLVIENEINEKIKSVKEKETGIYQSKLSIGLKTADLTDFEKKYVINLYNTILGGSFDSKFFKNIREKNSLAYYISSKVYKSDNLILIASGISAKNFAQVVALVQEELTNMQKGHITEEEVDTAKSFYVSLLKELYDSPISLIDSYFATHILGIDEIETRMQKIKEVTKDDIIKVSSKVFVDTIFLLEGEEDEKN
jgi:predicted Zn-dependent peptidase